MFCFSQCGCLVKMADLKKSLLYNIIKQHALFFLFLKCRFFDSLSYILKLNWTNTKIKNIKQKGISME